MAVIEIVAKNNLLLFALSFSLRVSMLIGQPIDECNELVLEIWHCSDNIPDTCDNWKSENEYLSCMERIMRKLNRCEDVVAQKIIKFEINAAKVIDEVFCPNIETSDITSTLNCLRAVNHISSYFSYLIPGFLSSKGCKFFKVYIISEAQLFFPEGCSVLIKDYINLLFARSSCGGGKVEIQNKKDNENLNTVYQNVGICLDNYKIPDCNSEKNDLLDCVKNATVNKLRNPTLRAMEANILDVAKTKDKIICGDENLKQSLQSAQKCLELLWPLEWYFIEQINGFFTIEGCEGIKYIDNVKCELYERADCHVVHEYLTAMKSNLTCAEKSPVVAYSSIIVFTLSAIIATTYVYEYYF